MRSGKIIECNLTFANKLGYEKSEVLGREIHALYEAACVRRAKAALETFQTTGEAHNVELQFHRKTGAPLDVMLTASAMRDAQGEIFRARCVWRDITERRQAIVYRRRLAAIVDASSDAIIGMSLDGRIVSWNPGAERLYGYKADEVIGQSSVLMAPEETLPELEALREAIRRGEEARRLETVCLRKDRRRIHVALSASPIRDDRGAPVGISLIARDITDQKRQETALRGSEERLRSLVRTAMDGVITIDMYGLVIEWNRAAEETFGYSRQQALGQRLRDLIIPPNFRVAHDEGLERFRQTGDGAVLNQRIEIVALHSTGREFPVELSIAPAQMGDETIFNAFVRDITDRRLFQKRLARQALEARLLHEVADLAAESRSFEEALQRSIDIVCELTGWPLGHAFVPSSDPARPGLVSTNIWSVNDFGEFDALFEASAEMRFAKGEFLPGQIWESGEPAWVNDVNQCDHFLRAADGRDLGVKSAFGFPVTVEGKTEAVLEFFSTQATQPDENLLATVRSVGQQLGRVIERRRAEKALRARALELATANDRLLQSNQELDDFAYVASHDLREPLRGIHNYATFLVEDYADVMDEAARQKLETLQRLAQRMDQLIDSLLQFSRAGAWSLRCVKRT